MAQEQLRFYCESVLCSNFREEIFPGGRTVVARSAAIFLDPEGSLSATTVVVLVLLLLTGDVVTRFR